LAGLIYEYPEVPLSEHLADIKDSVRYTIQTTSESYTEAVRQSIGELLAQGYDCLKFKNTWGGDGYKGINSFWIEPNSRQVFELQFHTPESFDAKMTTHGLYEEARLPTTSDLRRMQLDALQEKIFDSIPIPGRAPELGIPEGDNLK
jgi:hypothetical protein